MVLKVNSSYCRLTAMNIYWP